ncbi:MAG: hypothetical protein OXH34_07625, partial [Bacteroidetes bacterium]|nr:hypothetical protein [Bacteroidota bacterium]
RYPHRHEPTEIKRRMQDLRSVSGRVDGERLSFMTVFKLFLDNEVAERYFPRMAMSLLLIRPQE